MAVLVWDEKSSSLYVRCRPNDTFTPTEEIDNLVSEAEDIAKEYVALTERLTSLFTKCQAWNLSNDEIYAANHKAQANKKS